jgi:hypothetical protein
MPSHPWTSMVTRMICTATSILSAHCCMPPRMQGLPCPLCVICCLPSVEMTLRFLCSHLDPCMHAFMQLVTCMSTTFNVCLRSVLDKVIRMAWAAMIWSYSASKHGWNGTDHTQPLVSVSFSGHDPSGMITRLHEGADPIALLLYLPTSR